MSDTRTVDAVVAKILKEAEKDEVGLWAVVWELRETHDVRSIDERKRLALQVVGKLVEGGAKVLTYHETVGWSPWPERTPEEVQGRVDTEWKRLGQEPGLGDICWFARSNR